MVLYGGSKIAARRQGQGMTTELKPMSEESFAWYKDNSSPNYARDKVASGEWEGKAGAYGIQGRAGSLVPWISGSFTAVVGLPLAETANLLRGAGYPVDRV